MNRFIALFVIVIISTSCNRAKIEETTNHLFTQLDYQSWAQPRTQAFEIYPDQDTIIVGEFGTKIKIEAGDFAHIDKDAIITIELKEYYSIRDMALNKLSTISKAKLLETDGMLNIIAIQNGRKLTLAKEKGLEVTFPRKKGNCKSIAFLGEEVKGGAIEWIQQDSIQDWLLCGDTLPIGADSKLWNILNIKGMGYINCDRYLTKDSLRTIVVHLPNNAENFHLALVFDRYKSLTINIPERGSTTEKLNVSLPGEPATLIGIGYSNTGKILFKMLPMNTNDKKIDFPPLEPISRSEVDSIFASTWGNGLD